MKTRLWMRRGLALLIPCGTMLALASVLAAAGQDPAVKDKHPSVPPGEGRDVMIRVCSKCHEPEMAADQQNDEKGWKDTVDQMASKGAEATEEEFAQIVRYLARSFPRK